MPEEIPEYTPSVVETHLETGEPEHWPTERMITEDNGRYAAWSTEEDLQTLGDPELQVIASLCLVQTVAPEECIPCLASVLLAERHQERVGQSSASAGEESIPFEEVSPASFTHATRARVAELVPDDMPVADQFAARVAELNDLVSEMLEGPPIPPPGVTLEELSLLTVAAQRWIKITEAQGIDMSPQQQAVLDATKATVGRLNRG